MKNPNIHNHDKPVILIVDDTLTGRRAIASVLPEQEYDLSLASNGAEALSLATKLKPDVILLDVMMPGLSGYEVCRQIRSTPVLSDIPILMITSLTERDERLKGIASGAADFISKPFDALELSTRIRNITRLNRYRKLRERNRQLTIMQQDLADLKNKKHHLQKLAMIDDLTNLHNRRSLLSKGREEFERARRYKSNLSALMIDVDKFKNVNDTFGHGVGSFILKSLAFELKKNLRAIDIPSRLGGDEFFILLPHTARDSALVLAERLREAIAARDFKMNRRTIRVTISIGVSTLSTSMNALTELMEAADIALYQAKVNRNTAA